MAKLIKMEKIKMVKTNIQRKKNIKTPQFTKQVSKKPQFKQEENEITKLDTYELKAERIKMTVNIYRQEDEPVPIYKLSLLDVSKNTKLIIEKIRELIISQVTFNLLGKEKTEGSDSIKKQFKEKIMQLMAEYFPDLDKENLGTLTDYVSITSLGIGEIEFLLKDVNLEEIVVNSSKEPIWVYHKKHGWLKTSITLASENLIRHFSTMIGRDVNKDITLLKPLLDAHLKTGDRVNATLMPITTFGNTITIRKFAAVPWTITDFIKINTIPSEAAALIWLALQYELSVIIVGGTGSGKTSALNVISNFFPPNHRIISIEDTRELQLPKTLHWVAMETRLPNPEGKGGISMLDCVVNTLRMRPDRIIVGEIRREQEAQVLFEAMHTGHSVYGTFHANTAEEAVIRLTNPPINLPKIHLSSLGLFVVQNRNRRTGKRRTFQIAEILPTGDPNVLMQLNIAKDKMEKKNDSKVIFKTISMMAGLSLQEIQKDLVEKKMILEWIVKKGIKDLHEIGMIMTGYYVNKEKLLNKIKGD